MNVLIYVEDDKSITLSLEFIDIVVNGKTYMDAKILLIKDLKDYVQDYIKEPGFWGKDKVRKKQVETLIKLFMTDKQCNL